MPARLLLGLLALTLGLSGCSVNPVSGRPELDVVTAKQERELGKAEHKQLVAELGLLEDEKVQAYLRKVVDGLRKISHTPDARFQAYVLDDPEVNAMAVPGGYVYATRGLLAFLDSEAALAAVLGHEIGHVTAKHSEREISRKAVFGFPWNAIELVFPRVIGGLTLLASPATGLLWAKHSRSQEEEADELGVGYSHALGYDVRAMEGFFSQLERLEAIDGDAGASSWYSTHPTTESRLQAVHAQIGELQPSPEGRKLERDAYLAAIDGLAYGPDPRDGQLVGKRFTHPRTRVTFPVPEEWVPQVHSGRALFMSPKKDAFLLFRTSEATSLDDFLQRVEKRKDVQVVGVMEREIGGFSALRFQANVTFNGQELTTLSTAFVARGRVLGLHYVCLREAFAGHKGRFRKLAEKLRSETNRVFWDPKPVRVKVVTAKAGQTFAQLLEAYPTPPPVEDEAVAALNDLALSAKLQAGRSYKVLVRQ